MYYMLYSPEYFLTGSPTLCESAGDYYHNFLESVVKALEIKDDYNTYSALDQSSTKNEQEVEVHVLQSGQIEFSQPQTNTDSSEQNSCNEESGQCMDSPRISSQYLAPMYDMQASQASITQHHSDDGKSERSHRSLSLSSPKSSRDISSVDVSTQTSLLSMDNSRTFYQSDDVGQGTMGPIPPTTLTTSEQNNSVNFTSRKLRRSSRKHSQRAAANTEGHVILRKETYESNNTGTTSQSFRKSPPKLQLSEPEIGKKVRKNPMEWSIEEVTEFIGTIPRCNYTQVFRDHVSFFD